MSINPLYDRIVIEAIEQDEKTTGGIIIPDTAKEKPIKGKVVYVGKGQRTEDGKILPLEVKIGDTVIYGKWAGTEFKFGGKDYMIMKESDVLAIIN